VSPVKYELEFYIPEDAILHSHRRENLKSYGVYLKLRRLRDREIYALENELNVNNVMRLHTWHW
jgi:hypothetical protein